MCQCSVGRRVNSVSGEVSLYESVVLGEVAVDRSVVCQSTHQHLYVKHQFTSW